MKHSYFCVLTEPTHRGDKSLSKYYDIYSLDDSSYLVYGRYNAGCAIRAFLYASCLSVLVFHVNRSVWRMPSENFVDWTLIVWNHKFNKTYWLALMSEAKKNVIKSKNHRRGLAVCIVLLGKMWANNRYDLKSIKKNPKN